MAGKSDFTVDEWSLLRKSPLYAGLVVVAASPNGPVGVMKEMFAVAKLITETKLKVGTSGVVADLVSDLSTREGAQQARPDEIKGKSPEEVRALALGELKNVATLLERKAPAEAAIVKEWLQEVAIRVANAAKEGGFLGIGGIRVSEQEQQALAETATALGVAKA